MRNLFRAVLITTAVAAAVLVTSPSAPAATRTCTGTWTMRLDSGLGAPLLHYPKTAKFRMDSMSACVPAAPSLPSVFGTITGVCGSANGAGKTASGHAFTFAWAGAVMNFAGAIKGTVAVDATLMGPAHDECLWGRATGLVLAGTLEYNA